MMFVIIIIIIIIIIITIMIKFIIIINNNNYNNNNNIIIIMIIVSITMTATILFLYDFSSFKPQHSRVQCVLSPSTSDAFQAGKLLMDEVIKWKSVWGLSVFASWGPGSENRRCAGIIESNRCLPWKILKTSGCSVYAGVVVVVVVVALVVVVVVVRFFRLMMIPFTSHLGWVPTVKFFTWE